MLLRRFATFALCLVLLNACQEPETPDKPSGIEKGRIAAMQSIKRDELYLKEYPPLPYPPGQIEFNRLLEERCGVGIEVLRLPEGTHHEEYVSEVNGWNEVMKQEIRDRFGDDIFSELWDLSVTTGRGR